MNELAWAAGFWDGEGCAGTYRGGKWLSAHAAMAQVDREVLERFMAAVGGLGAITGPVIIRSNPKAQNVYRWQSGKFEHVQAIMAMLWKNIGTVKKKQFKKTMAKYHSEPHPGKGHPLPKA